MALKDDLLKVMQDMESDADFAKGVADKIKSYVASLKVVAASVAGSDTGGSFTGSANGTMSISGSNLESALNAAAATMSTMTAGGDAILAQAFVTGLTAEVPQWNIVISGQTTPPGGSPSPSSDAGTGVAVFNAAAVGAKLLTTFASMSTMTSGGDDVFATDLASSIKDYYTKPTSFVIKGATHLSGSQGNGVISE